MALRLFSAVLVLTIIGAGVGTGLGFDFVVNVKLPRPGGGSNYGPRFENSEIFTSNKKLLYEYVNRYLSSRVLRPLELKTSNRKQCPEGRHTSLAKYKWDGVPYLTCDRYGIPRMMRYATIATEDPTFYSNPGFDLLSILRAAYQDATSGQTVSGASTITQQFVKLYVLHNSDPTLLRKLKEVVLAWRLTLAYPKNYILYDYLNSVFYGQRASGVQAAAETYFHVGVSQLKLWQEAVLAGLPQAPSIYDPFNSSPVSTTGRYGPWYARMVQVLTYMRERGYINQGQVLKAERKAQHYRFYLAPSSMRQPDFVYYVIGQFEQMTNPNDQGEYDSYLASRLGGKRLNNGLRIYTTLRPALQAAAQNDVTSQVSQLQYAASVSDGALVSIDVRNGCYGCVMAMVGTANIDEKTTAINMAVSPRQPGSSFKVFNYVSAFEKGLAPGTIVCDGVLEIPLGTYPQTYYSPLNYDQTFTHGCLPIRDALAGSLNVPAVKVEIFNGINRVANTAIKFGISDLRRDNPGCCRGLWATTLGGLSGGVRLIQETAAYGAFATNGIKVPPISFTKIVDRATGKVLWRYSQDPVLRARRHRVAPAADAYFISSILSDNTARAPEFGIVNNLQLSHWAAAKTGTTDDLKDNWTEGYTPQIVTGVWVGNAYPTPMWNSTGITGAAPIWQAFMEHAINILRLPDAAVPQPARAVLSDQCKEPDTLNPGLTTGLGTFSAGPDLVRSGSAIPYCYVPAVPGLDTPSIPPVYTTPVPVQPRVQQTPVPSTNTNPQQILPGTQGTGNQGTTPGNGGPPPLLPGNGG
jgi:membrane peptidoglycan carboxypeptidase